MFFYLLVGVRTYQFLFFPLKRVPCKVAASLNTSNAQVHITSNKKSCISFVVTRDASMNNSQELSMIFLSEWNAGAMALILAIFTLPVIAFFFLLLRIIKLFPKAKVFLACHQKQNIAIYIFCLVFIFAASVLLTFGLLNLFS